jgi:hypothetical protein
VSGLGLSVDYYCENDKCFPLLTEKKACSKRGDALPQSQESSQSAGRDSAISLQILRRSPACSVETGTLRR